jgi:hypothetical protein
MSKYDSSTLILLAGSSNDDMSWQAENISIGNATRILNEHPIPFLWKMSRGEIILSRV